MSEMNVNTILSFGGCHINTLFYVMEMEMLAQSNNQEYLITHLDFIRCNNFNVMIKSSQINVELSVTVRQRQLRIGRQRHHI